MGSAGGVKRVEVGGGGWRKSVEVRIRHEKRSRKMRTTKRARVGWIEVLAGLWVLGLGVVWPVWAHVAWSRGEMGLHGIPAGALGWLGVLVGLGVGWWIRGWRRAGWRWVISRESGARVLSLFVLGVSMVVVFYTLEWWRGRRAWAEVERWVRDRGLSLPMPAARPVGVDPAEDFGQAPMFEPLHRAENREANVRLTSVDRVEPVDLGLLRELLRWGQAGVWTSGGMGMPGWMTGTTDVARLRRPQGREMRVRTHRGPDGTPRTEVRMEPTPGGNTVEVEAEGDGEVRLAEDFLASIEPLVPLLEEAARYVDRRHCRLPFDYEYPFVADGTSIRVLLSLERLAFARAQARAVTGQAELAAADIGLALGIARHGRALPDVFLSGWRAGTVAQGMQAVWEGLSRRLWSGARLEDLERRLVVATEGEAVAAERQARTATAAAVRFLEGLVPTGREPSLVGEWSGMDGGDRDVLEWVRRVYPAGWSLQNQALAVGTWLETRGEGPGSREGTRMPLPASDPVYRAFIEPKVRQVLEDARVYPWFEQACLRLAAAACGVERRRASGGEVPDSMERAGERGGPWGGGQPEVRYRRRTETGYVVYLDGFDGRDDGGGAASLGTDPVRAVDWVWVGK